MTAVHAAPALMFGLCPWCARPVQDTRHEQDAWTVLPCGHTVPIFDNLQFHRIALPYPNYPRYPMLSMNSRRNRWATNSHIQAVRHDVKTLAQHAGVKPGRHVIVHLAWSPKTRSGQDEDNLSQLYKVCCDALARGKRRPTLDNPGAAIGLDLVPDDTPRYFTKLMPAIMPEGDPPGMWLTVAVAPIVDDVRICGRG